MLRVLVCARYLEREGCRSSRARIALEAKMKLTLNGGAIAGSVFGPALWRFSRASRFLPIRRCGGSVLAAGTTDQPTPLVAPARSGLSTTAAKH